LDWSGTTSNHEPSANRRIPDALQDMAWENRHGLAGTKGLFTTGIPLMYIAYFAMNRLFGINVFRMPTSYKAAAWEFFIGTVACQCLAFDVAGRRETGLT
jgi:hypothetical protein